MTRHSNFRLFHIFGIGISYLNNAAKRPRVDYYVNNIDQFHREVEKIVRTVHNDVSFAVDLYYEEVDIPLNPEDHEES